MKLQKKLSPYLLGIGISLLAAAVAILLFFRPTKTIWIPIAIIVLGLLFVFLALVKKHKTDYKTMFYLGIVFLILYFFNRSDSSVFFILGIVFIAVGIANKDKWGRHKTWKQLSEKERKFKMRLIGILLALVVIGAIVFLVVRG